MAILKECLECGDTFYSEYDLCNECRFEAKRRERNEYDNGEQQ